MNILLVLEVIMTVLQQPIMETFDTDEGQVKQIPHCEFHVEMSCSLGNAVNFVVGEIHEIGNNH